VKDSRNCANLLAAQNLHRSAVSCRASPNKCPIRYFSAPVDLQQTQLPRTPPNCSELLPNSPQQHPKLPAPLPKSAVICPSLPEMPLRPPALLIHPWGTLCRFVHIQRGLTYLPRFDPFRTFSPHSRAAYMTYHVDGWCCPNPLPSMSLSGHNELASHGVLSYRVIGGRGREGESDREREREREGDGASEIKRQ
jgi:hypothetical protein